MCVQPNTPEYNVCTTDLAALTRKIASGTATAATWLSRGEWLQLISEIPGAIRDYGRVLARQNGLAPEQLAFLYVRRGVCHRRLLEFDPAVADIRQAIAIQPETAYFWACLGIAHYYQGQIEPAVTELSHAIELEYFGDERAWEIRAMCYQALGEHDKAIHDFSVRLGMDVPAFPQLWAQRAYSHLLLGQYAQAIHDCDHGERLDTAGDTFDLYRIRAHARYVLGEAGAALADFSRAIALRRDLAELYLWRGLAYKSLGDQQASADDLTEFVQHNPDGAAVALRQLADLFASASALPGGLLVPAAAPAEA